MICCTSSLALPFYAASLSYRLVSRCRLVPTVLRCGLSSAVACPPLLACHPLWLNRRVSVFIVNEHVNQRRILSVGQVSQQYKSIHHSFASPAAIIIAGCAELPRVSRVESRGSYASLHDTPYKMSGLISIHHFFALKLL